MFLRLLFPHQNVKTSLFPVGKEYDHLKTIELKEDERIFYSNLKDCLRAEEAIPNCDDDSDKTLESSEKLKCNANHHDQKNENVSAIPEETEIKVAIKNNENLDKNETSVMMSSIDTNIA